MSVDAGSQGARIRVFDRACDFEGMFAITREIVSAPPFDVARRELDEYPSKHVVAYVGEKDPAGVIGFCAASYPYWNAVAILDYLVVALAQRRNRLGTRLVSRVEDDLRAAGMRLICVQTIAWNVEAIRFYERLGYVVRARLPRYFDDHHEMVWLDRTLGNQD